jgi:hypothetical protein
MTNALAFLPQGELTGLRTLPRPIVGWIPNQVWNDEVNR